MTHVSNEFHKLSIKDMLIYILAVVSMLAGLTLLFLGLYIPPEGEIHTSVLSAFGVICIFVAALLGISLHFGNELDKIKANITQFTEKHSPT